MLIYKLSDLIVFSLLKNIKHGHLEVIKMNGEVLKFGDPNEILKVSLEIKDESFIYNLIKSKRWIGRILYERIFYNK